MFKWESYYDRRLGESALHLGFNVALQRALHGLSLQLSSIFVLTEISVSTGALTVTRGPRIRTASGYLC